MNYWLPTRARAMADLYEDDILLWSERQADLLRRLARGERVNEQIDWDNLVEEVESVGRTERRACESYLVQALIHELKTRGWPNARDVAHWRTEIRGFRSEARKAFTPSMRQRIDVEELYRDALYRLPEAIDGRPPLPLPEKCPFTLDELLTLPSERRRANG
jgi:hypothetical protein